MIICDAKYLAELRRIEKVERRKLTRSDWIGIDTEIGLLWELPDEVLFGSAIPPLVFNITRATAYARTMKGHKAYQGDMPRQGRIKVGTWFEWATVNKSNVFFQTWRDPDDMIAAFRLAHAIVRYLGNQTQTKIDKRSLENVNEPVCI